MANEITKVTDKNNVDHPLRDAAAQTAIAAIQSGYIQKSATAGLVKNDGTIDTTTYLSELPIASTSQLGGVKVDGSTVTINASGVISASGGGGGTTVVPNPSGTATADLNKVQIGTDIYSIPQTDISGKADKVSSPTSGDFASLDSNGNLTDSGKKASDFASSAIMDGQSIDSFGDVESALEDKVDAVSGKGLSTNDYTDADKAAVSNIPTVSVTHTGTASSTGVRKQQITVNNVSYDVDGSAYMEQSVTLSTSGTTAVTFTDASITANSQIQYGCSTWGIIPDDITCSSGSCVVTMPKVNTAATVTVRIYVR